MFLLLANPSRPPSGSKNLFKRASKIEERLFPIAAPSSLWRKFDPNAFVIWLDTTEPGVVATNPPGQVFFFAHSPFCLSACILYCSFKSLNAVSLSSCDICLSVIFFPSSVYHFCNLV